VEADDPLALRREYAYYDPIHTLPADGQQWWLDRERGRAGHGLAPLGTGLIPAAP
jgi:lysine 2,3-aminomutase